MSAGQKSLFEGGRVSPWRLTCPQNRVEMEWGLGQRLLLSLSLSHTLCTHTHTCICITSSHHLASGRGDEQVSRSLRRVTASLRTARSTFKSTRKRFCVYCKLIFARNYCLDWKHQQYSLLMYGSQTRCFEAYFLLIRSQTFVNAVRNLFRVKLMRQTWWFIKILIIIIIIIRFFRLCN